MPHVDIRTHRRVAAGRFDAECSTLPYRPPRGGPRFGRSRRPAATLDPIGRQAPIDLPCQTHDPDLWFAEAPHDLERAKAFCADCPARLACLAGALERREPAGVWGGQIFEHGRVLAYKRPRGRPRKYPAGCEHCPPMSASA